MKTSINVLFKSMQKDDKKEVLKFQIMGSEDTEAEGELFSLSGSIVVIDIKGCDAGEVTAEFMNIQRDSKKTVLKMAIKGEANAAQQLYKFAGRNVELSVSPSQMSIEEFHGEEDEGLEYSVNSDGTVDVNDEKQVTIDEVTESETKPDWQQELDKESNVVSLDEKREQKASTFLDEDEEMQPLED